MESNFTRLAREGRAARRLDQAAFAREVNVGQQTVSAWEQGRRRPRREKIPTLAAALGLDADELLRAAGYAAPTGASPSSAVRPRTAALPFDQLPADRFEDVCTEIAQDLHPDGHASRYGGQGESQDGIDILVTGPRTAAAQCKRHKQFGPQDVEDAVAAVKVAADRHFLFLSRPLATAAARAAIANYSNWELWDGHDISRYIRSRMAPEVRLRLVDTYFPSHRLNFLGIEHANVWDDVTAFYATGNGQRLFRHDWKLVGRSAEKDGLLAALRGQSPVVQLVGRGGLGKTRLLRAVAEDLQAENWIVRFLRPSADPSPADFEVLPSSGNLLLILDDAHDRGAGIADILSAVRTRNPHAQVLLSLRPYGTGTVGSDLRHVNVNIGDVPKIILEDLPQSEAEKLALEALGGVHEEVAPHLAALTRDCPLATTVAGLLIHEGKLNPARVALDEVLRSDVLNEFSKAIVADALNGEESLRDEVLKVLSATQPFQSDQDAFQGTLTRMTGVPWDRARLQIRSLEDSGVLLRRDSSLRLVPDLFGDVTLARASYDERDQLPTGYLSRLLKAAAGSKLVLQNVLVNASRLDWQIQQQSAGAPSVSEQLWDMLSEEFQTVGLWGRHNALGLLTRVAPFQPTRALEIIRWHLAHPADELEASDYPFGRFGAPTWESVRNEAAGVLQVIAYNSDQLDPACDLLWQLAKIDDRPTNQFPDHPLRVLKDLSEFARYKPLAVNDRIFEIASQWFKDGSVLSPFEVLEPLLATEASDQVSDNFTIRFTAFPLNRQVVTPLRQRLTDLAFDEARGPDIARAAAAVGVLSKSLAYPTGLFGRVVPPAERAGWEAGFVDTINRLGDLLGDVSLDPALRVAVLEALHWHAEYADEQSPTHAAARAAWKRQPDDEIFRLALLLHDGWGRMVRSRAMAWEESERLRAEQLEQVAAAIVSNRSDEEVADLLAQRLVAESRVEARHRPVVWIHRGGTNPASPVAVEGRHSARAVLSALPAPRAPARHRRPACGPSACGPR